MNTTSNGKKPAPCSIVVYGLYAKQKSGQVLIQWARLAMDAAFHLRCSYPRDYADPSRSGGIRLAPLRNVIVEHPLPAWIAPAAVLAIDHDRGLRPLEFAPGDGVITVKVDAVDAAGLLLVCPTQAMAAAFKQESRNAGKRRMPTLFLGGCSAMVLRFSLRW